MPCRELRSLGGRLEAGGEVEICFPKRSAVQVAPVGVPYWFLPDEGGSMTPASYEEMSDTSDIYLKVRCPCCIPRAVWNDVAAQLRSKLLLRCFSSPLGLVRCSLPGRHARIAQFMFWSPAPGVLVHRRFMLQTE